MTPLSQFLMARISEDEDAALQEDADYAHTTLLPTYDSEHQARWNTERVLADCAAKRRIVEEFAKHDQRNSLEEQAWQAWHLILRSLATVYAEHPEYDPTWAPF